ncbi:hypothetical protein [Ruania zhangjianzhongii]|uniref:hypothetical protein n=1 Tax=Ruania zhangjianzhongii TaxID=2603206 RepID=UPI0011CCBD0E|nr:hypothetical protein [Ruania zhangjianzhongii]
MLPREVRTATAAYLRTADRLVPGQLDGCYLVGSTALGAYRAGRSDIDLIAVLGPGPLAGAPLLRRLRALHLSQAPRVLTGAVRARGLHATCNVAFVAADQMSRPVSAIEPVASHNGHEFFSRAAFDVNPVMWRVLAERGITLRGPAARAWELDPEPTTLAAWNADNLTRYWQAQLDRIRAGRSPLRPQAVEWNVLGPLRLHATIATGHVLSKDEAGAYGQQLFGDHSGILATARALLAAGTVPAQPQREHWRQATAEVMDRVIADAKTLAVG